jgi:hypothetical protein
VQIIDYEYGEWWSGEGSRVVFSGGVRLVCGGGGGGGQGRGHLWLNVVCALPCLQRGVVCVCGVCGMWYSMRVYVRAIGCDGPTGGYRCRFGGGGAFVWRYAGMCCGAQLPGASSRPLPRLCVPSTGGYNYIAFDIANHFCEYAGFDFDLERWYPSLPDQVGVEGVNHGCPHTHFGSMCVCVGGGGWGPGHVV